VSWRILTDRAWTDLGAFDEDERQAIASDLLAWVEDGPPRSNRRELTGVELFDDQLPSGFEVMYLVDESVSYAAVLRIRRRRAGPP
jgi:hypothetical protein